MNRNIHVGLCAECDGIDLWVEHQEGKTLNMNQEDQLVEMLKPRLLNMRNKVNGNGRTVSVKGKNRLTVTEIKCSHCHQNEGSSPCLWGLW